MDPEELRIAVGKGLFSFPPRGEPDRTEFAYFDTKARVDKFIPMGYEEYKNAKNDEERQQNWRKTPSLKFTVQEKLYFGDKLEIRSICYN